MFYQKKIFKAIKQLILGFLYTCRLVANGSGLPVQPTKIAICTHDSTSDMDTTLIHLVLNSMFLLLLKLGSIENQSGIHHMSTIQLVNCGEIACHHFYADHWYWTLKVELLWHFQTRKRTLDSSGCSAKETIISPSVVLHHNNLLGRRLCLRQTSLHLPRCCSKHVLLTPSFNM